MNMDKPLAGQVAIVTGASRGIGRATALALANAGANVAVNYKTNADMANQVAAECRSYGSEAVAVKADVTKPQEAEHLILATTALGSPSILINNAGISLSKLLMETTLDEWNDMLTSHMTAAFLCTKAVLPYMIRNHYGRIVNVSSIWGQSGASLEVAYSAAKGGLISFTKALAQEVGRAGITVNAVAPGPIQTDMLSHLSATDLDALAEQSAVGTIGTPLDVANAILYLVAPKTSYVTGQVISPNGGMIL